MTDLIQEDVEEIFEQVLYQLNDFLNNNLSIYQSPNFNHILFFETKDVFQKLYPNFHFNTIMENAISYFFEYIMLPRFNPWSFKPTENNKFLEKHIEKLQNLSFIEQKSDEWFRQRHQIISASIAYKAVSDSVCKRNSLIYKKCNKITIFNSKNITTPFHHGHKYEPLSIKLYEFLNNTKVGEFGCIMHPKYYFLGASPDGINIKRDNPLFGRLLEVKNIVNRIINGIPSEAYWVQMQLQMECCQLNECDFLETRFKEYKSEEEFDSDGTFRLTKGGNYKGIMIQFHDSKIGAIYEYSPFQCTKKQFQKWYDEKLEENDNLTWTQNIFWYLDEYSCVLVPRNERWFKYSLPKFEETWNIIEKERVEGYEHRKPKKRQKQLSNTVIKIETQIGKLCSPIARFGRVPSFNSCLT
jgi:hypothetical protein